MQSVGQLEQKGIKGWINDIMDHKLLEYLTKISISQVEPQSARKPGTRVRNLGPGFELKEAKNPMTAQYFCASTDSSSSLLEMLRG